MHVPVLQAAKREDIPLIATLAEKIWRQYYPEIIGIEQVNYMLSLMYDHASLAAQMEKGHQFYLLKADDKIEGFASVTKEGEGDWFINKFYLNQDLAGRGIGTAAFNALIKMLAPETIRLTVNRKNFKSINFYFKNNFSIERVADFDIGNGYVMNDFVMIWRKNAQKSSQS